ncbi:MAG: ATP-dependent Clp protease proteolytic subunit [Janthinobacterium lividum]
MSELVITVQKYIGESSFNWDTFEFEMATSADDVRMFVEYAEYSGQVVDSLCFEIGTCFGGSTLAGIEIYNYAQGLNIPIRTRILSFAASMATILMLVGDVCEIDASASVMVHAPSMDTSGTARKIGTDLKALTDTQQSLRDIYVARTGQPVAVVEEWMSKDTFFTAAEALELGLVTKVIPIAPKAAATQLTDAQASARRAKYAGIVARADHRAALRAATPKPKVTSAATPASISPRPMAKTPTTAGAAAARRPTAAAAKPAAAKPTALNANQKAVQAFAKQLGVSIKMEGEATVEETTAAVVETVLANGDGSLFTDGELVEGSAVFNDQALTISTADGTYGSDDNRDIVVAGGVVDSITDTTAEGDEATTPAASTDIAAAITAALAPITKELGEMRATFNKAVPPTPRARGVVQVADGKTTPKPKAAHHAGL